MATALPTASILERYHEAFPKSYQRYQEAQTLFPSGVTHDMRYIEPFPVYIDRAKGSRKWTIEGHELIDLWSGHGALILGHAPDGVVSAVQQQMARGTHLGGCHELEIAWGKQVLRMLPGAERIRFTGTGTEATLMALRLCRLYTGRPKFLKFAGHFHGWHDFVAPAADPPYEQPVVPGIVDEVARNTVTIPPNDIELLERTLASDPQIGALILEPTGGHWGAVPIRGEFLRAVRELTRKYGQVLIFDEVITGFRVSPGGAQTYYGIQPDLTTMAKILAGGLPGGALAGSAEILDQIAFRPGKPKMRHPGTFNANPLSAAAGIATLREVETGTPTAHANRIASLIRNQLNEQFNDRGWNWTAYGDFSMVRLTTNDDGPRPSITAGDCDGHIPFGGDLNRLDGPKNTKLIHAFRQAMVLRGVDLPGLAGMTTAAHTESDVATIVAAVVGAIEDLQADGLTA
ncbi:aspartate aminotransferase family protein [Tuwongella immobilis]|uniref:Aspartate aminotransferase family protein n=1 Tax=Tuwongella immobilis TaxID=692036 RepID=A0A6C2YHI5_9BACT|nr:aminotransferase class III-fold pyridoxal phosphate-dependent enzyme [Tuwongella immobilis]VIP00990.1 glutamate-1-semialdehyde -aminomutase : Glutamate-1-semialdehyde 2,1-aminomutase, putative OS=Planctomyces maris DSM 8797 GN=PM8797T_22388 PE=3 SV=1: Aminotran_3 [Tuwongella immobilis]VTR97403.1 glutamate-1-semialdehyde -aminomutase : Glutamate-1-semialdehyde 2,1-aminomutase, putative OS=Planctomyces maris DSM 8797 GN=PM8797T_22388 PE=3 SV=1: Aminotran_3 [Tuwongella immobilis]